MVKKLRLEAVVNGSVYQSDAFPYIESEKAEQIASCKRQIEKMLDEDGFTDVRLDYMIREIEE